MSGPEILHPLAGLFRGRQFKPTVILLVSTPLLVTWRYVFYHTLWGDPAKGAVASFLACFLLLGVVPALIVKLVFRERLADYGVQWGIPVRTFRSFLMLAPVFLLAAFVASANPAIREEYPVNPTAGNSAAMFGFHALTYVMFYLGWEFYFRGFMQFGLRESLGDANALLIQVLASCLLHIGKPGAEVYGAIFGGILWGLLAYRTRSLLSGLAQHFLLGLALDWFICFG